MGVLKLGYNSSILYLGTVILLVGVLAETIAVKHPLKQEYPWEKCRSMGQIVGTKCEEVYYECDYGDMWFTKPILCNNCIGDCPPGRVFHHPEQEACVWPETIGCGCTSPGQFVGRKCENAFYICAASENENGEPDWISHPVQCVDNLVYDPQTHSCVVASSIGC